MRRRVAVRIWFHVKKSTVREVLQCHWLSAAMPFSSSSTRACVPPPERSRRMEWDVVWTPRHSGGVWRATNGRRLPDGYESHLVGLPKGEPMPEGPMWRREQRSLGAELVADCEAFLLGRYADRLESLSIAVPVWAWTNLLAHADEHTLRAARLAADTGDRAADEWHAARGYLAAAVLDAAGSTGALAEVQWSALVPLEMDLARRPEVGGWSCRQWVDAVRAALAGRRSPHA